MSKMLKRIFSLGLALMLLLPLGLGASAADVNTSSVTVEVDSSIKYYSSGGSVQIYASITNNSADIIELTSVLSVNQSVIASVSSTPVVLDANSSANVILTATTATGFHSSGSTTFKFDFESVVAKAPEGQITPVPNYYSAITTKATTIYKSEQWVDPDPGTDTDNGNGGTDTPAGEYVHRLRLSAFDEEGKLVSAPKGNAGENCIVRLPLVCVSGFADNITVSPVLSTSLDTFPFDIDSLEYSLTYKNRLRKGGVIEFRYTNLKLSSKVTAGVKKVDFLVTYFDEDKQLQSMTVSIYVNVVKGYVEPTSDGGDTPIYSVPKLIVESYTISPEKIYAGETFDVSFTMRNTSTEEDIKNLQIRVVDSAEVGKLVPADSASNTLYVDKIGKGDTHTASISFQSAPDTEAKAYTLDLSFDYEGAKSKQTYKANETIAVPIMQKIRTKIDAVQIYDDGAMPGQSIGMYVAMYNMGKSQIYNCMVDVEGEGLAMEETYFAGNVASGGQMRADFTIIASVPGQIAGNILISYEDMNGEQYVEKAPFSLYVQEDMMGGDDGGLDPGIGEPLPGDIDTWNPDGEGTNGGTSVWLYVGIGVGVLAIAAVVIIIVRKRRNKELEDV